MPTSIFLNDDDDDDDDDVRREMESLRTSSSSLLFHLSDVRRKSTSIDISNRYLINFGNIRMTSKLNFTEPEVAVYIIIRN